MLSEGSGAELPTPEGVQAPKDIFLAASAQCLVLGNFSKPHRHVIEALTLYTQCKYMSTKDPAGEVWILFGIIVRQVLRMGYHRDPKHFRMSVFEGEMRRRCWAMIRHFDLMNAFQCGLPGHIQAGQYDTALPRNLDDSDFDESSTELPESRPETIVNSMTYFISKGRLMNVFEKILYQELSMSPVPYTRVMELDAELRQAHASVPLVLKNKPMAQSFADPSHVIMVRLNIELLYQKSICVLHRKYLTQKSSSPFSKDVCAAAAMEILGHQASVDQEAQPGGQLYQDRWMLSSFTYNDFFLAAMILCLDVSTDRHNDASAHSDDRREVKIDMIERSYYICSEQVSTSKEARRVTTALEAMLTKLRPSFANHSTTISQQSNGNTSITPAISFDSSRADSVWMDENNVSTGPLQILMNGPENVDWVSETTPHFSCYEYRADWLQAFLDQYLLDPSTSGNTDPNWPDPTLLGYLDTR